MSLAKNSLIVALYVSVSMAGMSIRRGGWLDRVVEYHKNNLLADLKKLPPLHVKVSIKQAPRGYVDSSNWDFDSVVRLIVLLQHYGVVEPLILYLRKTMPYRRFMKYSDTFLAFPSLYRGNSPDLYYDVDSKEIIKEEATYEPSMITDDSIIIVSNPTEARLPSAQISVRLLKEILETRAKAARYLPTTVSTIKWNPMNATAAQATTEVKAADGDNQETKAGGDDQPSTNAVAETTVAAGE